MVFAPTLASGLAFISRSIVTKNINAHPRILGTLHEQLERNVAVVKKNHAPTTSAFRRNNFYHERKWMPTTTTSTLFSSSSTDDGHEQWYKCSLEQNEFVEEMLFVDEIEIDGFSVSFDEKNNNQEIVTGRTSSSSPPATVYSMFQNATISSIFLMKQYDSDQEEEASSVRNVDFDHLGLNEEISSAIDMHCNLKELYRLNKIGLENGSFLPFSQNEATNSSINKVELRGDLDTATALVTLRVPLDTICAESINWPSIQLRSSIPSREVSNMEEEKDADGNHVYFLSYQEDEGQVFEGKIMSKVESDDFSGYIVNVLMNVRFDMFQTYDLGYEGFPCRLLYLSSLWDRCQKNTSFPEGIEVVDNIMSTSSRKLLMENIEKLSLSQEVDYHPHSNNIVRDLVHPALYSYIKGESPLLSLDEVPDVSFVIDDEDAEEEEGDDEDGNDEDDDIKRDYWGRKYEESAKYQWLPTYFDIDEDGKCSICDYINNLTPRENYSELYSSLEDLFSDALPAIESVYNYARQVKPNIRYADSDDNYNFNNEIPSIEEKEHCSLKGQRLQVITKIVDYELEPGQTYDGVWHVEGMSHEEIVATALYVLHRDEDIEGGDILFKRAFFDDEVSYIWATIMQMRPIPLEDIVDGGMKPVGTVQTLPGRLVVFPNSHVHKVNTIKNSSQDTIEKQNKDENVDDSKGVVDNMKQKRRIVVFFLVNPEHRIISTREVPPQQQLMSRERAFEHRLNLMKERKYHKQDWNVRDIELCEH